LSFFYSVVSRVSSVISFVLYCHLNYQIVLYHIIIAFSTQAKRMPPIPISFLHKKRQYSDMPYCQFLSSYSVCVNSVKDNTLYGTVFL